MKTLKILSLLSLFIIPKISQGQAAILALLFGDKVASENFNLSMEIGGNYSFYSNLEEFKNTKLGINFGISGNIKVNNHFYISPNIYFLSKRFMALDNISLNSSNEILNNEFKNTSGKLSLSYTDIPILFSYLNKSKSLKYSLGPQLSFLGKTKLTYENTDGDLIGNIDNNIAKTDFGLIADIAYIIKNFKDGKEAHVHLRYIHGMTDVFESKSSTNRSSSITVMISFPFVKN